MSLVVSTLLFVLLSQHLYADEKITYRKYSDKGYVPLATTYIDGTTVNIECAKNGANCLAVQKPKSVKSDKKNKKWIGHPANDYCLQIGGEPTIVLDQNNNQYNFCQFKDGSIGDSWDIYYKNKESHK